MAQEIERKFLVKGDFKSLSRKQFRVTQAYLSSVPGRTVRIRIRDDKGYITIKGLRSKSGASRYEWEKEIPLDEAKELLNICEPGIIDKTRFLVEAGEHTYEVDEFYGKNNGLIVAEIELESEDEDFKKPLWLGEEVTGINKYYNSMLAKNPYRDW